MRPRAIQLQEKQIQIALVAIYYLFTAWLTQTVLGVETKVPPIWFPAGISLFCLLLWGHRVWLGIFLGDLFLNLFFGGNWGLGLIIALGRTLSALVGLKLLHYCKFSPTLTHLRDVIILILLGGMVSTLISATLESFAYLWLNHPSSENFALHWWMLWLGNSTGILILIPFLLQIKSENLPPSPPLGGMGSARLAPLQGDSSSLKELFTEKSCQRLLEFSICFGLLFGIGWVVFVAQKIAATAISQGISTVQYLEYLPFPLMVWAALRFQIWGAVSANLLVTILVLLGTLGGVGPFILQSPTLNQAVFLLQIFLLIVITTTLILSATVAEREQAEKQLRLSWEREHLVTDIALRIRQSLELDQIFQRTVTEVRNFLNVDRVYIGYIPPDAPVRIVAEAVLPGYQSLLGWTPPTSLLKSVKSLFVRRDILVADDVSRERLPPILKEYYDKHQVKSALVVPLLVNNQRIGILVAHQCSQLRHWHRNEITLLQQLATQVSIAIQQAQLYQQLSEINANLESQVKDRTLELQEKMQELKDLYGMKKIFLQAVSHDLRTSVMGLLMLLKNLRNRAGDSISISRSILERMIEGSDRQLSLINALSEEQFAEHRSLGLNCQPLSLRNLIESIIKDWQHLFRQNQVKFKVLIPHNLPDICADASQLRAVFDNLLTNALKHNPPGINLTIEVSLAQEMIQCKIADDGVGMDEKQCEELFKLYVRSSHNQRRTGIGLGSYQCRQIIEAHGGTIGVKSTPGVGSQFWFTLPISQSSSQFNLLVKQ